ncbi:MAG: DMT family transporter [Streptosporangiaceae bacterium]
MLCALAAACCFALAAVVQHGAARESGRRMLSIGLLLALVRNPRWLVGGVLGALSFAIMGLALAFGPLSLVQPIAATDVLFALPMIAVRHRYRLTRRDWVGAIAVGSGIAVFLTVSPPVAGVSAPGIGAWIPVLASVTGINALAAVLAWRVRGRARVIWLAAAAGATFGVVDALTKSFVDLLASQGSAALMSWEPYALMAAGLLGALVSQSAFQAGALSVSLPVIDTLEPVSAVLIAATVFSERLASSPGQLAAQLAGGAVAVAGIAALSRSSVAAAEVRRPAAADASPRPRDNRPATR